MEGNKECWEQGGCPPYPSTVQDQWRQTLAQAVSSIPKEEREKELEVMNDIWEAGQQEGKLPPFTANVSLVYALSQMEKEAKEVLEQHRENKKGGPLAGPNWRKKERNLENNRRLIHLMAMACAAVHRGYQMGEEGTKEEKIPEKHSGPAPTSSLYPQLSSVNTPPPYQMPVAQITEGILKYDDEGQRELIHMMQRLSRQLEGREGQGQEQEVEYERNETEKKPSSHTTPQTDINNTFEAETI